LFILVEHNYHYKDYYVGKTYIVLSEYYPWVSNNRNEAKKYTTRKRAENACIVLNKKVGRSFQVEPE